MNTYFIVRRLVPPYKKHRYMRDGKMYDYLGQILVQMDIDIPEKCRTVRCCDDSGRRGANSILGVRGVDCRNKGTLSES